MGVEIDEAREEIKQLRHLLAMATGKATRLEQDIQQLIKVNAALSAHSKSVAKDLHDLRVKTVIEATYSKPMSTMKTVSHGNA